MERCCLRDADKGAGMSMLLREINQARKGEKPRGEATTGAEVDILHVSIATQAFL